MILWAFECGLDCILLRVVRAEARAEQTMDAFRVRLHRGRFAGNNAPTDAPSRDKVILRHSTEGDAGNVRRDRSKGNVRCVLENELVVDFIGENYKIVATRQFCYLLEHLPRAKR